MQFEKLAPVVMFVYNRPEHTKQAIESLQQNQLAKDTVLYIFADGPKQDGDEREKKLIAETRSFIKSITGFREVIINEKPSNEGLANSVIKGVTEVINKHKEIIVLEDDLLVSPHFLDYMNDGLAAYRHESNVYSINAYMFPVETDIVDTFLCPLATSSWGWATWADKWEVFEKDIQDKKIIQSHSLIRQRFNFSDYNYADMLDVKSSWAIKWYYSVFIRNGLGVFPTRSLVQNTGFDGSGTHGKNDMPHNRIYPGKITIVKKQTIDFEHYAKLLDFFKEKKSSIFELLSGFIKK